MDLIDRYLYAVQSFLPKRDQQDIVKELADDIRSQLDDRETELGRPLGNAELESFLKQMGHPMLLAARFRPQRHLVGPAMFPFFQRTLAVAIGVAFLVNMVLAAVMVASGRPSHEITEALVRFPTNTAVTVFGWVTLVFAFGEWALGQTKLLVAWDPGALPPVPSGRPQVSRLVVSGELVGIASALVYLLLLPAHPWLLFGPAAVFLQTGPAFDRFYLAIVLLVGLSLVTPAVNLFRPDWTRLRAISRLSFGVAGLVLWSLIIDSGPYVILKPGVGVDQYAGALKALNGGIRFFFVFAWITTAIDVVREAVRMWRTERQAPASA
jgi:hypothetical protein